jgi:hypothetical protein
MHTEQPPPKFDNFEAEIIEAYESGLLQPVSDDALLCRLAAAARINLAATPPEAAVPSQGD